MTTRDHSSEFQSRVLDARRVELDNTSVTAFGSVFIYFDLIIFVVVINLL